MQPCLGVSQQSPKCSCCGGTGLRSGHAWPQGLQKGLCGMVATSLPWQPNCSEGRWATSLQVKPVIPVSPNLWRIKLPYELLLGRGSISASAWGSDRGWRRGQAPAGRWAGFLPPWLRFWNKKPKFHEEHPPLRPWGQRSCLY